jgi:hypothetical protein
MLGPAGAIKICAATDSAGAFVADGGGAAVCNGIGLLEALSVAHPAGSLLKEAVHGQQVLRSALFLSTARQPPPADPLQSDCIVPAIHVPPLPSQQQAGYGGPAQVPPSPAPKAASDGGRPSLQAPPSLARCYVRDVTCPLLGT